jgi:DNA-binding NtrC family response regulator
MREAVGLAQRVAATDSNVLITGESGAGKDVLAAYIHAQSPRARESFVKIDCSTLPADLLEAELFGYERGAFTGAMEAKPGRFEAAHRGTLVLDEIAYVPFAAQAKLLRVIETREFERLGGRSTIKVDARLIALSNVDLEQAIKRRQFREDLFYRLNVVHIRVPPLRARKEDLVPLSKALTQTFAAKHGREQRRFSAAALELLREYDFPGNVRELANTIERAVIVSEQTEMTEADLPDALRAGVELQRRRARPRTLAQMESDYVAEVLQMTGGNKSDAARVLGISRKNLYERIARLRSAGTNDPDPSFDSSAEGQ